MGGQGAPYCIVVLGLLAVAATPVAAGVPGSLHFSSSDVLGFEADVEAAYGSAQGFVLSQESAGANARFETTNGTLTIWTWRVLRSDLVERRIEEPHPEPIPLSDANLTWSADVEDGLRVHVRDGGLLSVSGRVVDAGLPARMPRDAHRESALPIWSDGVPGLWIHWETGWIPVGTTTPDLLPLDVAPRLVDPTWKMEGRVDIEFTGGTLVVEQEDRARSVRLGTMDEASGTPGVSVVTRRVAVLETDGTRGTVFPGGTWGIAGPETAWHVDGVLRLANATGRYAADGEVGSHRGGPLTLDIRGTVVPDPPAAVAPFGAVEYAASGDIRSMQWGSTSIRDHGATYAPAALSASALLLLALTKWGQMLIATGLASLYTRLAPSDLLDHPQRRRMHDLVAAEPGIHQRELHRRLGGAWGPFAFHLRMLEKGDHLRVVKQGGYRLVFPAGAPAGPATIIPHPVARAIYESLPSDGRVVPLTELASLAKVSRELLGYHVRVMESRGLVRRVPLDGSRKGVGRTERAPTAAEPTASRT